MKIFEIAPNQSKREQDVALRNLVLARIRMGSPLFEFAQFYTLAGGRSDKPEKESSATGGKTRDVNNPFANNPVDTQYGDVNLKIYGDDIRTDLAWNRWAENGAINKHEQNLGKFAESLGRHIADHHFNGDTGTSTQQFDGLKAQVPAGNTITANDGSGNGMQLQLGNTDAAVTSRQKFSEYMSRLIKNVAGKATVLWAPGDIISRMKATHPDKFKSVTVGDYTFDTFDNVPIVDPGYNKDESAQILPLTETVGTSTTCGSVYAVRYDESAYASMATSIGMDVSAVIQDGNFLYNNAEIDLDLALLSSKAAFRLEGVYL